MVSFPNCKINIGLHITEKRKDNYHNLQTIFYPIPFYDALEIVKNVTIANREKLLFSTSGISNEIDLENNICYKAYQLIKKRMPNITALRMHLHKNIPLGAGLGGGSADGAFTLQLLNNILQLNLSEEILLQMALKLGSDCPFFIKNKPCYAEGRGEILKEINLNLKGYYLIIVNPRIHISTADLFSMITPQKPKYDLKEIVALPLQEWKTQITNDFEEPVFNLYPQIKSIKDTLYAHGASYASLTGTGSTVYGFFKKDVQIIFNDAYFIKKILL